MFKCDCGCIEEGAKANHPPSYVCKCAFCSGHNTGWIHAHHAEEKEEPTKNVDVELVRELVELLKTESKTNCNCSHCKSTRKLIRTLTGEK